MVAIPFQSLVQEENSKISHILREEAVYLVDLDVIIGRRSKSFQPQHLSVSEEAAKTLRSLEGKIICQMFPLLNKMAGKLNYQCTRLKSKFLVYSNPFWYLSESSAEEFYQEYQKIQELSSELLAEVSESYFSSKRAYQTSVEQLLATVELTEEDREKARLAYVSAFPTFQSIKTNFGIFISRLEKIDSLREQSAKDAFLAETEGKISIMKEYSKILEESRHEAMKLASKEIYEILAEQIAILTSYAGRDLPKTKIRLLEESCDRISILVAHTQRLGWDEILEQLNAVRNMANRGSYTELQSQVQNLKATLKEDEAFKALVKQEDSALSWVAL